MFLIQYRTVERGAEERQGPRGERLLPGAIYSQVQHISSIYTLNRASTLTRIITSRSGPSVQDKVQILISTCGPEFLAEDTERGKKKKGCLIRVCLGEIQSDVGG